MNLDELLKDLRVDYIPSRAFDENTIHSDPILQMQQWLQEAFKEQVPELNAMVLSTADKTGDVSSRVVLLKEITHEGLFFYTNYLSHKALDIADNHKVAINFFWQPLARQVRIQGTAKKVTTEKSDRYFSSRPRKSQIAAVASLQSQVIGSRKELDSRVEQIEKTYVSKNVPRPDYWGGYCITPDYFEFWQGNQNRLHDRICYQLSTSNTWQIKRLAP